MKMSGEQRIAAPRERVWEALNDPAVLRQSIPGCQSLEKETDDRMRATVEVKIGPIGARFNGVVTISDPNPPESYIITGEGQGGTVGTAKGGARVRLTEAAGATLLSYEVDAQVGGRLAQLGGPIIDATAKQLAGRFFSKFGELVEQPVTTVAPPAAAPEPVAVAPTQPAVRQHAPAAFPLSWLLAVLSAALIGFLIGGARTTEAASDWMGIAVGLLLLVVAAVAFEFGRRTVTSVLVLDSRLLQRLVREDQQ
jgi:uncharacterized protein